MPRFDPKYQAAEDEAIAWIVTLRSENVALEQVAQFAQWLAEAPENQTAFDSVVSLWELLGELPPAQPRLV